MLIFKSFLFTLPASIRVCTPSGFIMRDAQGDLVGFDTFSSGFSWLFFFTLKMCPILPLSVFRCSKLRCRPRGKAAVPTVGKGRGKNISINNPRYGCQARRASWLSISRLPPSPLAVLPRTVWKGGSRSWYCILLKLYWTKARKENLLALPFIPLPLMP